MALGTRNVATAEKLLEAELKPCLHALYKMVHPDLFTQMPKEQAENARSLKLLHDYLAQCRGDYNGPTAPFRFVFFKKGKEVGDRQNCEGGDCCEKVAMVLPPPVTVPHDFPLPSTTRLSLKRLLMALGVSPELLKKLDVGDEYESLRSFFIDAAEHVRWNEATDHTASQRLHNAKLVFKMSRQVHVGVGGECEKISASEQADLIEGLAWSLDRAESVDLNDKAIMIGGEGIDSSGRLWLPRGHSPEEWRRAVLSADLEEMQRRKEHVDQVKAKEKSIAKRLGIDMIYTSDNIRSQNCYLTFLTDLGIMAEMSGCIISPDESHDLAVCVVSQEERDPDEALSIDSDLGFFRVPMDVDPARIYRYIQSNQEKAQSIKKRHTEHEAAMQELGQSVRQRLRLRKLHRDPLVSHAQFHKACYRLLRNASSFGDWTEGLYLRVSFANRLYKRSTQVDIKWNFSL